MIADLIATLLDEAVRRYALRICDGSAPMTDDAARRELHRIMLARAALNGAS